MQNDIVLGFGKEKILDKKWICSSDWTRSGVEGFIKLSDDCTDKRKKGK